MAWRQKNSGLCALGMLHAVNVHAGHHDASSACCCQEHWHAWHVSCDWRKPEVVGVTQSAVALVAPLCVGTELLQDLLELGRVFVHLHCMLW